MSKTSVHFGQKFKSRSNEHPCDPTLNSSLQLSVSKPINKLQLKFECVCMKVEGDSCGFICIGFNIFITEVSAARKKEEVTTKNSHFLRINRTHVNGV